jgi:hypothetical protein
MSASAASRLVYQVAALESTIRVLREENERLLERMRPDTHYVLRLPRVDVRALWRATCDAVKRFATAAWLTMWPPDEVPDVEHDD